MSGYFLFAQTMVGFIYPVVSSWTRTRVEEMGEGEGMDGPRQVNKKSFPFVFASVYLDVVQNGYLYTSPAVRGHGKRL